MATIVIFQLDTDPFGSASVGVSASFTVDIIDNDTTFERTDSDGSNQFDISTLPNFQGNSNSTQTFESYSGDIGGNAVDFTLLQFSGALYMVVNNGTVNVGDTIDNTNNSPNIPTAPDVAFNSLADFVCFCRGSEVSTPFGPKPVETLRAGDMVNVMGKAPQRLRWIGNRRLSRQDLVAKPRLAPVRVSAHAFGYNIPAKDIYVSPRHRIALDGIKLELLFGHPQMLCPAISLTNDTTITQECERDGVEYWHLLFDEHELVETSGLWTESFFVGPTALADFPRSTAVQLHALFPQLKTDAMGYGSTALPALSIREGTLLNSDPVALLENTQRLATPTKNAPDLKSECHAQRFPALAEALSRES